MPKVCKEDEILIGARCIRKEKVTVQMLADEYRGYFEKVRKPSGDIWVAKEKAPPEVEELVQSAHGEFFPDDWRYEFIVEALNAISETEYPDDPEIEADVYTNERLAWLCSNINRANYVDEARKEFGAEKEPNVVDDIGLGQRMEKEEVYFDVLNSLRKTLGE